VEQPTLAATLRAIAAEGSAYLYEDMAAALAAEIQGKTKQASSCAF